jgi:hypothetical protein
MVLHSAEAALIPYIQQFVERQQIVEQALRELRPEFLLSFDDYFDWIMQNPASNPDSGYWGEHRAWRYSIHGHGCRLTHIETGEPLDWNPPNVDVFNLWFFKRWLEWALTQEHLEPVLQEWHRQQTYLDDGIKLILERLEQEGILWSTSIPGHGTGYALVETI